jgi:peptide chain release factor 1
MLEKLAGIEARYEELERLLADPAVSSDYARVAEYAQERASLADIVDAYRKYKRQLQQLADARALLDDESDDELRAMAETEVVELDASTSQLYEQLKVMLLPKDPRDEKNVIMEIRAGTGGEEAALFAADLFRMYARYAETRGWKVEILDQNETGKGGYKEVVFRVKGKGAYSRFKYESGVHRVQRVPETEASGRIHTSTATVAVLAEVDPVEVHLDMKEVRMEFFRSSGAGGQHVQKNATAVRLIHEPTGLVVEVQDERSQLQNRERAMAILASRLYDMEMERQHQERADERRSQVGTGERSEKIRTYNYPQSRVTDHRINVSNYNLPVVMDGDLDEFIDELATRDQAERLGGSSNGADANDD